MRVVTDRELVELAVAETLRTMGEELGLADEAARAALRMTWNAALRDVTVTLLWRISGFAVDGRFACSMESLESVAGLWDGSRSEAALDLAEETGIDSDRLGPAVMRVAAALRSIVGDGELETSVGRKRLLLVGP